MVCWSQRGNMPGTPGRRCDGFQSPVLQDPVGCESVPHKRHPDAFAHLSGVITNKNWKYILKIYTKIQKYIDKILNTVYKWVKQELWCFSSRDLRHSLLCPRWMGTGWGCPWELLVTGDISWRFLEGFISTNNINHVYEIVWTHLAFLL